MINNHRDSRSFFNPEELTDVEIALYYLKLLDNQGTARKTSICDMAEMAMQGMNNPYAKKLLARKITGH